MTTYPRLLQTVLDTTDVRGSAEFYRRLLGLAYRPGDEPPTDGEPDDADWLVLLAPDGGRRLAFQETEGVRPTTWPDPDVPMQLHLDLTVTSVAELEEVRERALTLGRPTCSTGPTTPTSRCTSSRTPRATRSACSWPEGAFKRRATAVQEGAGRLSS